MTGDSSEEEEEANNNGERLNGDGGVRKDLWFYTSLSNRPPIVNTHIVADRSTVTLRTNKSAFACHDTVLCLEVGPDALGDYYFMGFYW